MFTNTTNTLSTFEKHGPVNEPNAGVTIRVESCDGVQFLLHCKDTDAHIGAFPGAESTTLIRSGGQEDLVYFKFDEPADVLEILLKFVEPRRPPDLQDLKFAILAPLAEAVEKYKVFSAMRLCERLLRTFIATNPAEILSHSTRHDYPRLSNDAAFSLLSFSRVSLDDTLDKLPVEVHRPWIQYHEAWVAVFALRFNVEQNQFCINCPNQARCQAVVRMWICGSLEKLTALNDLKAQLSAGPTQYYKSIVSSYCKCPSIELRLAGIVTVLTAAINSIPPFTEFQKDSRAAKLAARTARQTAFTGKA